VITRFSEIQRERKAEAMRIVADLGRLGHTYEAAMALIGVNAPGDVYLIAILQPICNIYSIVMLAAMNV